MKDDFSLMESLGGNEGESDLEKTIDSILGSLDEGKFERTLEEVQGESKDAGVDSSYEGTMIAEENINKLLSDIDISTSVKEQMVLRLEPLDIDNEYEHFLMQSRMCGVPIEVFLGDNFEDELKYEIPEPRQVENMVRRKEVGEVFEDRSLAFKENTDATILEESKNDNLGTEVDLDLGDFLEEEEIEEIEIEEIKGDNSDPYDTLELFKNHEEEEEVITLEEVEIDFEEDILIDIEEQEIPVKELEDYGEEKDIISEYKNMYYEDDEDIINELVEMGRNITPTEIRGGKSSTYSLEELNPVTGGSDEV